MPRRFSRLSLLQRSNRGVEQEDEENETRVGPVSHQRRDDGGEEQHVDERARELPSEYAECNRPCPHIERAVHRGKGNNLRRGGVQTKRRGGEIQAPRGCSGTETDCE
jgi:hypothetical protein